MHEAILTDLKRFSACAAGIAVLAAAATAGAQVPTAGTNLAPSADRPAIQRRDTGIDGSGHHEREMRACLTGRSHQVRDVCLEEARNAQAARQRGELKPAGENYMANALARCEPLPAGEERYACEARVLGFGNTSGSVAGGGLLRWVETVVLPPGQDQVTFAAKTKEPVVIVPATRN
jgi:hypothetical protein